LTWKIEPKLLIRSGLAISCIGHIAILTLGLIFAGASPFDSTPIEAITVDIVSPSEVATGLSKPEAMPTGAPTSAPETEPSLEPAAQVPPPQSTPPPILQTVPPADPVTTRQAAASTQAAPSGPSVIPPLEWTPEPPPAEPHERNAADMFAMPLTMPDGRLGGTFDAPAIEKANISNDDIAAFRKHLKACSILPAGVADDAKVTLRIHLNPDGTLTRGLDQNPHAVGTVYGVSVGGGDLFMSAVAAVRKCQPYKMLPPDRYEEWKTLDLTFTRENF